MKEHYTIFKRRAVILQTGMLMRWKAASTIAAVAAVSIGVILYLSSVHPCNLPLQSVSNLLAPASPRELYDGAELVVVGRITDSTAKCEGTQIWTHMKVEVEESLKNPQNIRTLEAKSYGGAIGSYGAWQEDSPIFEKGSRVFLYLYKDRPGDEVYRISPYSGALADDTVTGRDILRTYSLKTISTDNASEVNVAQGSSEVVALTLESFFGYDSPTNVTASSFTFYNKTVDGDTVASDYYGTAYLDGFGIYLEPEYVIIKPRVNGTVQTEFRISAADDAIPGVYDIRLSATEEDRYAYLAGGVVNTYVRVHVLERESAGVA